MSDRPIQVGDLVQVVRPTPCCGSNMHLGEIFRVTLIHKISGRCGSCGKLEEVIAAEGGETSRKLFRLKRIPPLDELESTKDTERLKETA